MEDTSAAEEATTSKGVMSGCGFHVSKVPGGSCSDEDILSNALSVLTLQLTRKDPQHF